MYIMNNIVNPIKSIKQSNIINKSYKPISRRGLEKLDFLLLLIETIEINGVDSMIMTSKQLGIEQTFSNRVELWKTRAHNPLRRSARRGKLSNEEIYALISLISATSQRMYPLLRQLLSKREPSDIIAKRWQLLTNRFIDLINERMNTKREGIQNIICHNNSIPFLRELVLILALSTGSQGLDRLTTYIYQIH